MPLPTSILDCAESGVSAAACTVVIVITLNAMSPDNSIAVPAFAFLVNSLLNKLIFKYLPLKNHYASKQEFFRFGKKLTQVLL
jgi:hypothetical protein